MSEIKKTEVMESEGGAEDMVKKKFQINPKVKTVLKVTAISAATAVAGFLLGKGLKEKNNETDDLTFIDLDDEDFDEAADGEDWLFNRGIS